MIRFRSTALCASVLMALTACGGGDADLSTAAPAATLTGLAATGAAIPNADVTARCVAGDPLAGKTDANGVFTLTLSVTHTAPCMLEVVNGTSRLYSFATEAGRVNITPATDLVVAHALKGNPADDCGRSWTLRTTINASTLDGSNPAQATAFVPSLPSQWHKETVSVANLANKTNARIKFQFIGGGGNNI